MVCISPKWHPWLVCQLPCAFCWVHCHLYHLSSHQTVHKSSMNEKNRSSSTKCVLDSRGPQDSSLHYVTLIQSVNNSNNCFPSYSVTKSTHAIQCVYNTHYTHIYTHITPHTQNNTQNTHTMYTHPPTIHTHTQSKRTQHAILVKWGSTLIICPVLYCDYCKVIYKECRSNNSPVCSCQSQSVSSQWHRNMFGWMESRDKSTSSHEWNTHSQVRKTHHTSHGNG